MEQLAKVFNYGGLQVRTVLIDGGPWFVAKDICDVLEIGNPSQALKRLDGDEWNTITLNEGIRGNPNSTVVNEPGLYSLILGSRKPQAREFKRWITHEVIPAIRKHGGYLTPEKVEEALLNPDTLIRLAKDLKREREERERLQLETERQAEVIEEQAERLTYLDEILKSEDTLTITQIAADYGMTARQLNAVLREVGVQRKAGGQWVLCAQYLRQGLTKSKTHVIPLEDGGKKTVLHTRWTQAGRLLIHQILVGMGIRANQDVGLEAGILVVRPKKKETTKLTLNVRIETT